MRRHERDELPSDEDLERFSDVTTTCPHCGATLYDDAEVCYQCGQAISGRARHAPMWVMVVAIVAIAGIVTAMVLLRF